MENQKLKKLLRSLSVAVLWLAVWELLSYFVGSEVLLPSPFLVIKALMSMMKTADYYISSGYSILRILLGFLMGVIFGIIISVVTKLSKWIAAFLSPLLTVIKATPIASFIILLMVWVNRDIVPVFTSVLIVTPIVCGSFLTAINETDANLLEMAKAFNMSKGKKIKKLYIPSVLPHFSSSSATALGMAWKAGTAAEVICNPHFGIGSRLYDSKIYLEVPKLFAWTVTVVTLSFLLEKLFSFFALKANERRRTYD